MATDTAASDSGVATRPRRWWRWVLAALGVVTVATAYVLFAISSSHAVDRVDGVVYWPSYHRYQALVRDALVDPDSARFEALFFNRTPASRLYLCGRVNARNRMGGYTGYRWFYASRTEGVFIAASDNAADAIPELEAVVARCKN